MFQSHSLQAKRLKTSGCFDFDVIIPKVHTAPVGYCQEQLYVNDVISLNSLCSSPLYIFFGVPHIYIYVYTHIYIYKYLMPLSHSDANLMPLSQRESHSLPVFGQAQLMNRCVGCNVPVTVTCHHHTSFTSFISIHIFSRLNAGTSASSNLQYAV